MDGLINEPELGKSEIVSPTGNLSLKQGCPGE
jgi:hypothetical protein